MGVDVGIGSDTWLFKKRGMGVLSNEVDGWVCEVFEMMKVEEKGEERQNVYIAKGKSRKRGEIASVQIWDSLIFV